MSASPQEITDLLQAVAGGQMDARNQLIAVVFHELRKLAGHAMRNERQDHTLQPSALVSEAYVKMMENAAPDLKNRTHFFALASRMMRQVLVDHARAKATFKRGGHVVRVSLGSRIPGSSGAPEILALHDHLTLLERIDSRQCHILEMRYFGGMEVSEIAAYFDISLATVFRELKTAKLWLKHRLNSFAGADRGF